MAVSLENFQENEAFLNMIYYGIAKQLLEELLEKGLITQSEYYAIDDLNRVSFHQEITSENSSIK